MRRSNRTNIPEFTVTDISLYIKQTLESEFSIVRIKGEMGRVSRPVSGHIYFDLKDSKSVIAGIIWRTTRISEPDLVEEGNEVVLKLHRVGFTSFQHVKKKRRYTANKRHISELYASRLSAETEKEWLDKAHKLGLSVPKVMAQNRHIIKMELVDGIDLVKLNKLPNPMKSLEEIVEFIKIAWKEGGFVHGDISEHNIIIRHDDIKCVIIDFPQAEEINHKNALELLERDVVNVLNFFSRKFNIETSLDGVMEYITE